MDTIEYEKYYRVLNIPKDASLHELDERYFECIEYWTSQDRQGDKSAKLEIRLIDEAYGALLQKLMKVHIEVPPTKATTYTMQQIVNGQERINNPSTSDCEMWLPPQEERSSSSGSDDEMDVDAELDKQLRASLARKLGTAPGFRIREIEGDIRDAPDRAVIVHAVNCLGVWGFGIAKELKNMCPAAFEVYQLHCKRAARPYDLIGTCLLIPPQPSDYEQQRKVKLKVTDKLIISDINVPKPRRWIACLFTSIGYGRPNMKTNNPGKGSPSSILTFTRTALEELRTLLEDFGPTNFNKMTRGATDDDKPGEIWSPMFNSGAFGVDWGDTQQILIDEFNGFERLWLLVNKINEVDYEPAERDSADGPHESNTGRRRKHSSNELQERAKDSKATSNGIERPLQDFLTEQVFLQ